MEVIERVADQAMSEIDRQNASNPAIKKLLEIVHKFIQQHRLLCYGGTAINLLLPKQDQFYDPKYDIPDYDFFSEIPQVHAMKLADRIAKAGYKSVEVKPGSHMGTFKVFADYIGVADITYLNNSLFRKLWDKRVEKQGIAIVPPNFLRMSMYLELSRPKGDVSRWTKVYTRLLLLNKHYHLSDKCNKDDRLVLSGDAKEKIEHIIKTKKAVILGFNAASLHQRHNSWEYPVDLLVTPEKRQEVVEALHKIVDGVKNEHTAYAEIIPPHTDISKHGKVYARVFETSACHSFHETTSGLRIASIPTLLQFFFAMMYADEYTKDVLSEDRLLCVAQYLMDLAHESEKRRYKLLTPIECIGHQESLIDLKKDKSELYSKLNKRKSSREYLKYFFSYVPTEQSRTRRLKARHQLRKTLKNR
jgi:Poly(A) polymerase catalytic subunit